MVENLNEVKSATLAFLGRIWEENYLKNRNNIRRTPGVKNLFDRFKNLPSIVVGAGPSLDRNIKYMQYASGKAVIIACDTALKILKQNGVKPDIVINLDPQSNVVNFFEEIDTREITLVAPTIAYPPLREAWKGHFFFYNKNAPDIPLLAGIAHEHRELGLLTPGGSVLSVAFDLAFKMGADPIAFIGQDLSYSADNAYASGGHYTGYKSEQIFDIGGDNIVEAADLFGRKLKTQKSMFVTNEWFKWAFERWNGDKKRTIYNCSEAGILTSCEQSTLSDFVSSYCRKKLNVAWTIKKACK
ncbi:MAG: DUF115 domain-containing protein [Nitrospinota bacterium]|nr:DUF115 domain-containing protein [Nitrospinota bacterium]